MIKYLWNKLLCLVVGHEWLAQYNHDPIYDWCPRCGKERK